MPCVVMIVSATCGLRGVDGSNGVESRTKLLQSLGGCGFDGEHRVVRNSPTGVLQLLLKVDCAARKREGSFQDAGHCRATGNKRHSLPVLRFLALWRQTCRTCQTC